MLNEVVQYVKFLQLQIKVTISKTLLIKKHLTIFKRSFSKISNYNIIDRKKYS